MFFNGTPKFLMGLLEIYTKEYMRIIGSIAGWFCATLYMCVLGWVAIFNPRKADELFEKAMEWSDED